MPFTNEGKNLMAGVLSAFDTQLDEANAYIGVGDSSISFDGEQKGMQGASVRSGMDTGYPVRDPDSDGSMNKLRYRSYFNETEGNFIWNEWGLFNASSGGQMLNREVQNQGEKPAGAIWIFETDIEITLV
jgi:hypothetical protein